eukprot:TRINITY_DN10040_c0_g1_i1.p1 TRINITY_DN10040_c0_g1~~TRINITY_DN10040_c0_g1_i1.p1  ORF type:complete len:142 (-),score=56.63 TRINITY_DN10040_c0_g1_i1:157-582(-)
MASVVRPLPPNLNMAFMEKVWGATKPKYINGRWKRAQLGGLKYARLKKKALEWDLPWADPPEWEKKLANTRLKPPKGRKSDREFVRKKRIEEIQKALNEMPRLFEQQKKEAQKIKAKKEDPLKALKVLFPDYKEPKGLRNI